MALAVIDAGHALVPLSNRLGDDELVRATRHAGVRLALCAPSARDRMPGLRAATGDRTHWQAHSEPLPTALPPLEAPVPPETALVVFTSGTTGSPKAVLLTHQNLVVTALTMLGSYRLTGASRHLNALPLAHLAGTIRLFMCVAEAATHVILPRFDPGLLTSAIRQYGGTHTVLAPTMVAALQDAGASRDDLGQLDAIIYGTATMPRDLARWLVEEIGCDLFNGYGLTESCALAVLLGPEDHRTAIAPGEEDLLRSVGWAVPGIELRLVDEDLRDAGDGQPGEILLRGPKVSPGYLRDPDQTRERFTADGWLRTRDVGTFVEGRRLRILGRADDLIISGGLNIEPEDVERAARRAEAVADCAAFGVPDERWGHVLHLAVVPAGAAEVTLSALREFLEDKLDRYKHPKQLHVVERLPRTSTGKVQRSLLRERLAGREPSELPHRGQER